MYSLYKYKHLCLFNLCREFFFTGIWIPDGYVVPLESLLNPGDGHKVGVAVGALSKHLPGLGLCSPDLLPRGIGGVPFSCVPALGQDSPPPDEFLVGITTGHSDPQRKKRLPNLLLATTQV